MFRSLGNSLVIAVLLACIPVSNTAFATGLQVSPVSLTVRALERGGELWLSNTGDTLINAQIRVFHWTQENNEDQLTPSQGLVVSPPMIQLAPNSQQLVRVIRTGAPPSGADAVEDAYRLIINELPGDTKDKKGLQFLLRYSLPIFIEPLGTPSSQPQLSWSFQRDGAEAFLEVNNSGVSGAQIADVVFHHTTASSKNEQPFPLAKGLLGYVLPHKTMRWKIKLPTDVPVSMDGAWSAMINSVIQTPTITVTTVRR